MKKLLLLVIAATFVVSMIPLNAQEEVFLRLGCVEEPETLNLWKATDIWTMHVVGWFYPSFYDRKPETMEILPEVCTIPFDELLAESPDGLTFTFPLRDDVYWDDGTPLTAYDYEFTYDLIMELQFPNCIHVYEDVEYIRAVNDHTVELKLKKCTPQFEESLIFHFPVPIQQFEPMLIEARGTPDPLETFLNMPVNNPVSAGPFSFDQWVKGDFIRLVTNPDYHGTGRILYVEGMGELIEGPHYDGLFIKLYRTTEAALDAMEDNVIDFVWHTLDPAQVVRLLGNPNITIEQADCLGFMYLAPNCAKEPFDDLILRQALVYLVDKEFIASSMLQGHGGPAHSVVVPIAGDWYCDDVNKFGSGMSKDERIATATAMLTQAGYTVPSAKYPYGVLKLPDGTDMQPFKILTPPADYDPIRATSGMLIQEWWREIGVPVTATPTSFNEIMNKTFETMAFDWYILGWRISGSGYPDHMRTFFHSDQAVPNGGNPMSYVNPQADSYLEDLVTLCNRSDLIYASHEAQKLVINEVGYCPLYFMKMNEAHRNDTFANWFTQQGGIARYCRSSCLLYLVPITGNPVKAPIQFGSFYLGTILFAGVLVAAGVVTYRKRT